MVYNSISRIASASFLPTSRSRRSSSNGRGRSEMPFTHYPKLDSNVVFQWRWPIVPVKPAFLGRKHPKNLLTEQLKPGDKLVAYHSAQNFTRFYGSIYADVPLEVVFSFSNDEYDDEGDWVNDKNIL